MPNDGVESHALAFLHEEIPGSVHPVPGRENGVGKGGVMQNAWCGDRKPSMNELQRANFRFVVAAELDENPRHKSGDGVASVGIETFEGREPFRGYRGR